MGASSLYFCLFSITISLTKTFTCKEVIIKHPKPGNLIEEKARH